MSNGYLAAAAADLPAAREIAEGFGLDVIDASATADPETVAGALAEAPNLGIVLSVAASHDESFLILLRSVAVRVERAQLILMEPEAREAFQFLPEAWPAMSIDEARMRASALMAETAPAQEEAPPEGAAATPEGGSASPEETEQPSQPGSLPAPGGPGEPSAGPEALPGPSDDQAAPPVRAEAPPPPASAEPPPPLAAPQAPAPQPAPQARASSTAPARKTETAAARSAPADATAFAPRKLRRGTPELVRIVVHQPKDLAAVIKAARKIDPSSAPAPQGMPIGEVPLGASIGVSLEVRGAACDGAIQRRTWGGDPIDFAFSVEADAEVRQAVLLARVFINDAQIGVIAFTRPVSGAAKKPASGDRVRLKRHRRVFLSYSSHDRETVSAIATAYRMAGVEHFWDRTSLKSGEEWTPRLRREIDRADLFHLCWSRSAAASQWVEKEAQHALSRRRRIKKPDITVQMLDGPPWAPHPESLDSINFDDFVRAAIVGYARGEG